MSGLRNQAIACALLGQLAAVVPGSPAEPRAASTSTPASTQRMDDAERLVFLLQYVGSDYAAAVRDGKIVDESEYQENREFVSVIGEKFRAVRESLPKPGVASATEAVEKLSALVANRADPKLVREITESLIPEVIRGLGLRAFPRRRPDTESAAALYVDACLPCHGTRGDGNGPQSKSLDPPAARFTDRARMDSTAPYVFYNAITLGVDDTGMASFADFLSDQQRWDLAFYLWTFALPGEAPKREAPPAKLSLRDLATRSSLELAPEIRSQAATRGVALDVSQATAWGARLRAHPPALSDAEERLARLRVDLAETVRLLDKGDFDAAADRVTTSYLSEFEPLEPDIDRHDARVRQAFEHDLIEFRAALRRSDRAAAAAAATKLEQSVDRSAELLRGARADRGATIWLVPVVALLAAGGFVAYRKRAQ